MSELTIKKDNERFVFADGYQDLPNETTRQCVVVNQDLDLSGLKLEGGELVPKTTEDLQAVADEKFKSTVATFGEELDNHLNAKAAECGYDDIKTAVTYADEPAVEKFQTEGKAFRAWRSLCYAYAYDRLEAFHAGGLPPTVEDFLSGLPPLNLTLPE